MQESSNEILLVVDTLREIRGTTRETASHDDERCQHLRLKSEPR